MIQFVFIAVPSKEAYKNLFAGAWRLRGSCSAFNDVPLTTCTSGHMFVLDLCLQTFQLTAN